MAAAPALGGGMICRQQGWQAEAPAPLMRVLALLLLAALAAPAATFYVTISGLGGEADYDQRFKMWAQDIDSSLKKAGTPDPNVFTLIAPTREQIRTRFAALASAVKATDNLVVVLIGHGTFDGVDYKFNLPGPDITGAELATLLDRVPSARQLVVVTTSSSGGSIEFLRKPNRIVIAATKAGSEKNATIFARYWSEALRDTSAQPEPNEFFDPQKLPPTEQSVFEDTGRGTGVAAAAAPDAAADSNAAEGRLAASFTVVRLGAHGAASKEIGRTACSG